MTDAMREQFEKWHAQFSALAPAGALESRDGQNVVQIARAIFEYAWQSRQPEIDALIAERDALRTEAESWKAMYHAERKRIEEADVVNMDAIGSEIFLDGDHYGGKRVRLVLDEEGAE